MKTSSILSLSTDEEAHVEGVFSSSHQFLKMRESVYVHSTIKELPLLWLVSSNIQVMTPEELS